MGRRSQNEQLYVLALNSLNKLRSCIVAIMGFQDQNNCRRGPTEEKKKIIQDNLKGVQAGGSSLSAAPVYLVLLFYPVW